MAPQSKLRTPAIRYNWSVTAKESLVEWVGGLSEAEAAAYLQKVCPEVDVAAPVAGLGDDPLLALLARWDAEGPSMTEEQWNMFAANLEEDRLSYRKRFG